MKMRFGFFCERIRCFLCAIFLYMEENRKKYLA